MAVYTPVTITGYNTSPPPDDGSTGTNNQLTWAKHKDKLGDPLKTAIESINTNVSAAFSSNSKPIVAVTHEIESSSSTIRSDSMTDSGWGITVTKSSATSTLFLQLMGEWNMYSSWDSGSSHQYTYIKLTNSSGTLITGTTDNILIADMKDAVGSGLSTNENGGGFSRTWKVTAANCPDGTSGANEFKMYCKTPQAGAGGTQFNSGTWMVWEIEV